MLKYGKLNSSLKCKEVIKNERMLNINSILESWNRGRTLKKGTRDRFRALVQRI